MNKHERVNWREFLNEPSALPAAKPSADPAVVNPATKRTIPVELVIGDAAYSFSLLVSEGECVAVRMAPVTRCKHCGEAIEQFDCNALYFHIRTGSMNCTGVLGYAWPEGMEL